MKTKNYLFSLLLLSALYSPSLTFAQDEEETYSRFASYATGGLNLSKIKEEGAAYSTGFNVGVGFAGMLNRQGSHVLSLEVLYSQQGTKVDGVTASADPEYLKLNYINIPVIFRFSPIKSNTNFYIGVGPQIGFNVGGHLLAKDGTQYSFKDGAISSTVFDAVGTMGILMGDTWDFGIEVRYQHGISKILETSPDTRSQVLQAKLIMPLSFLSALSGQ